ncbi:hypothetical protein B0H63DRAFT_291263 [Podospora didyma]|uniref:Uncharacterized protein n=1 Tax=Podospora didyma TaxID=330526 RepID=A0AAE0K904_9PEZI|nr:hypothetical protein B0H63DRAFT_291263 [Podospora didyma]
MPILSILSSQSILDLLIPVSMAISFSSQPANWPTQRVLQDDRCFTPISQLLLYSQPQPLRQLYPYTADRTPPSGPDVKCKNSLKSLLLYMA